ncbi:MAG: peroxiredoxin [Halobacteriota archaeon]
MEIDSQAPGFCLPDKAGERQCLRDFRGRWVILYFYPRDNTSGCTREAMDFSEQLLDFEKYGAAVIGISPDSPVSHQKFAEKHQLRVLLLSDERHEVADKYGVWKLKRLYGKESYGVERSTFLITPEGNLAREWRKVKVSGHVDDVKQTLETLKQQ